MLCKWLSLTIAILNLHSVYEGHADIHPKGYQYTLRPTRCISISKANHRSHILPFETNLLKVNRLQTFSLLIHCSQHLEA